MSKARHKSLSMSEDHAFLAGKKRKPAPHEFVLDAIASLSPYTHPMFGCLPVYLKDKIVLFYASKPQAPRITEYGSLPRRNTLPRQPTPGIPQLAVYSDLGKSVTGWQVLPADAPDFESAALRACELVLAEDPRIGKVPEGRRAKTRSEATRRSFD